MKDEIKEYVIKFHNTYEKLAPNYGYETRKDTKKLNFNSNNGKLMYATINEIITPLLDYITNLQEKLKVSQTNEETYRLEMQDITKILGLDEHTTFDEVKEYATNLQEKYDRMKENAITLSNGYSELEKRNEKAIEYFKYQLEQLDFYEDTKAKMLCAMGIVILQGEDKDE